MVRSIVLLVTYLAAFAACALMTGLAFAWHEVFMGFVWILAGGFTAGVKVPDALFHLAQHVHWRRHHQFADRT